MIDKDVFRVQNYRTLIIFPQVPVYSGYKIILLIPSGKLAPGILSLPARCELLSEFYLYVVITAIPSPKDWVSLFYIPP